MCRLGMPSSSSSSSRVCFFSQAPSRVIYHSSEPYSHNAPLSPAVPALRLSLPLLGFYFPVFRRVAARRVAAKDRGIFVNSSIAPKRKTQRLPQSHLQFSF